MATIADVYVEARALLNDVGAAVFNDATLLPFVKKAYSELQRELRKRSIQVAMEISAALPVNAGVTTLATPADFLYPIRLEEREAGSTLETDWRKMKELPEETDGVVANTTLGIWAFRENEVKFRPGGSTQNREVRLFYTKSLIAIVDGATTVSIIDAQNFLASRSAAIAAASVAYNLDIASTLQSDAEKMKDDIIDEAVIKQQSMPVRRRPFRVNQWPRFN